MFLSILPGTTVKRMEDETDRLNEEYQEIVPAMKTLPKCLKYLCQKESYRMLKDWNYENEAEPYKETEYELQVITNDVVKNISEKIKTGKKNKLSKKKVIDLIAVTNQRLLTVKIDSCSCIRKR